ncbi:hypothetical protein T11_18483 [Trichinella zimbabwensis]|uniref:Uncharacterized protein n=1 Tax=Trichinella zimbabwensis TaxID=268475 RepID=A0A0V1GXY5_9BILA|nr:hypothetical protein T11_18483 [Trichinella zimbabwensis]
MRVGRREPTAVLAGVNSNVTCRALLPVEFPHSLPTPLSWSGSWEYGDEYTTKRKLVISLRRQVKTVVNRWIWPHDGTDQMLDVDSKRANCSIPSVAMTNRWTMDRVDGRHQRPSSGPGKP